MLSASRQESFLKKDIHNVRHLSTWFFAVKGLEQDSAQRRLSTEREISSFQVLGWLKKAEPWLTLLHPVKLPVCLSSEDRRQSTPWSQATSALLCRQAMSRPEPDPPKSPTYPLVLPDSPHLLSDLLCHSFCQLCINCTHVQKSCFQQKTHNVDHGF